MDPKNAGSRQRTNVARRAGKVSIATMTSRVLGLVREQVVAVFFGAGFATDAFNVAFRIPNLLRDLFAEGALSSAFVPVFSDHLTKKGKKEALSLANSIFNSLTIIVSLICLLGILFSPFITKLMAPGFSSIPGKLELTAGLTRIMFPFLLFISLAALAMGVLNSLDRFFVPALSPTMFNLGWIGGAILLSPLFSMAGMEPVTSMAVGVLVGGAAQFLIQVPFVYKEGFRWKAGLELNDPGLRRVLVLAGPAVVGLAATQVNILVNTQIASFLREGSVSWLNYAFRLMQLPIGVFGVAIATVTLPSISRHISEGKTDEFKKTITHSLELIGLLTIPCTFLFLSLSSPIVSILYQHGRFGPFDTTQTAHALIFYSLGLFGYSSVKVLAPAFYALGTPRVPVTIGFFTVGTNIALNLILMRPLGHIGLALSTSVTAFLNMGLLMRSLRRRTGRFGFRGLFHSVLRMLLASAAMAIVARFSWSILSRALGGERLLASIFSLLLSFLLAGVTMLVVLKLMKAKELSYLRELIPGLEKPSSEDDTRLP
ncbi:MAG: murein biosynthesis integral membrane protein MurJ [Candidatus Eisenbacteria bacterium]|nr:murein biosynthesis integral membrane protein MurJ [Candidatus Eisenbacteria bacterium]